MFKIDLHTHSHASVDGSITLEDYRKKLTSGSLDMIAITDHDSIEFARDVQMKLGARIIVGEEITTNDGEIIGLYLTKTVKRGMSCTDTVKAIQDQGGLVYIPHPFETVREGISPRALAAIADDVDIVEISNGRAFWQNRGRQARAWATQHLRAMAASSDAHGTRGWGKTYSETGELPERDSLIRLLNMDGTHFQKGKVGLRGVSYPKFNRLRKRGLK